MATSKPTEVSKDFFRCPICLETLKSPKILPCLHTFCEKCLSDFIVAMGQKVENKMNEFTCPICRTVVKPLNATETEIDKWASLLPNNATVLTMINVAKGEKQECHACKRHEQHSDAIFWCRECDEAMCDKCNDMHSWMKYSSSHSVVQIENVGFNESGIDFNAITDQCNRHPSYYVEAYCSDHAALCCIFCVTLNHRDCKRVTAINTFKSLSEPDDNESTLQTKLTDIKNAAEELLKLKEKQKGDLKNSTKNTEEDAGKFVEVLKCKLDNLFQGFIKQLHIFRDEKVTYLNIRIRLLEQFIKCMDHWIKASQVVKKYGTQSQMFIHMETMKQQIKDSVEELKTTCRNDHLININFEQNHIVEQINSLEQIGNYNISEENIAGQLNDLCNICRDFGVKRMFTFEDVTIKKLQSFHFPKSNLKCGTCINDDFIILGYATESSNENLHFLDKKSGSILETKSVPAVIKRLCYSRENRNLFISCKDKKLFRVGVSGEHIEKSEKMAFSEKVGALCIYQDWVYVVANNAIKKFTLTATPDSSSKMTLCFRTNTTSVLSGMDIRDGLIYYTTIDKEIKCAKINGEEIFCYKSDAINTPQSITVLSSGLVLVVDKTQKGALHILSSNGNKHKTLLKNFEHITNPTDIWFDNNEETLYIAGGEYIEVFKIKTVNE